MLPTVVVWEGSVMARFLVSNGRLVGRQVLVSGGRLVGRQVLVSGGRLVGRQVLVSCGRLVKTEDTDELHQHKVLHEAAGILNNLLHEPPHLPGPMYPKHRPLSKCT